MTDEERPVHVVIDCSIPAPPQLDEDGNLIPANEPQIVEIPLTDEEWAQRNTLAAQDQAERAQRAEHETALAAAALTHPDPLVQELARRVGILPLTAA